jgi:RHS repeat-associated protein
LAAPVGVVDAAGSEQQNAVRQPVFGVQRATGYSKHYYAGAERVSSRIGGGMQNAPLDPLTFYLDHLSDHDNYAGIANDLWEMVIHNTGCAGFNATYLSMEQNKLESIGQSTNQSDPEPNWYIYHSDHLGSSAFLTDASGDPTQHLQYMPFGETFVEQRSITSYYTPYTFSAKERDTETGYSYFGARYYDADISVWLSVDPMADKYPSMSAFMYCAGNPVMLVDHFGLEPEEVDNGGIKKFFRSFVNLITEGKWADPNDEEPLPRQILRVYNTADNEFTNNQNNVSIQLKNPLDDAEKQDFSGFWG